MAKPALRQPLLSLIVPTRGRTEQLRRLLDSLIATASHPQLMEVVLVVDEDDLPSIQFRHDSLLLKRVVMPPGQTMGDLNRAGYEMSSGRYVMLLNDDVVARTPGWDDKVLACFRELADDILLVHTNDLIFKDVLCTFPIVARTFCELTGGICPGEYIRYRIDDHIGDVFNLLAVLGEPRTIYLPDVVFEHFNFEEERDGRRLYPTDPKVLALDAARFESELSRRKELALRLKEYIDSRARQAEAAVLRAKLDLVHNSFVLRRPWRFRAESAGRSSQNTPVTVAVLSADMHSPACRECVGSVKEHSSNHELLVLDHGGAKAYHFPRELNRLLSAARTEHVVLLHDHVRVTPGWLDGLLGAMTPGVGVVTPVQRGSDAEVSCYGAVFHPDGSGHHGHLRGMPNGVTPVLSFCSPVLLLDRMRCRHLLFDETHHHYFIDLDFGLRVWESGLRVVCNPEAVVTNLAGPLLPYGASLAEDVFEADRRWFVTRWFENGRLRRVERDVWCHVPELDTLIRRADAVRQLLEPDDEESLDEFKRRAARAVEDVRDIPLLMHALLEGAVAEKPLSPERLECLRVLCRGPESAPAGSPVARKLSAMWTRAAARLRRGGFRALAQAAIRRLLPSTSRSVPSPHALPHNPTRDARR